MLQVLQVESVVEGHQVRMAGDPPEGHVVLLEQNRILMELMLCLDNLANVMHCGSI